jgi:hypothetical protein
MCLTVMNLSAGILTVTVLVAGMVDLVVIGVLGTLEPATGGRKKRQDT